MKKILLAICVLCAIALLTLSQTAFATETEQAIADIALQNDKVVRATSVVYMRSCVVALQTKKFASREEYDEFVAKLTEQIKKDYEIDTVYVSRSPKVMQIVDRLSKLDEASRQEIVRRLIEAERLRTDATHKIVIPTVYGLFE